MLNGAHGPCCPTTVSQGLEGNPCIFLRHGRCGTCLCARNNARANKSISACRAQRHRKELESPVVWPARTPHVLTKYRTVFVANELLVKHRHDNPGNEWPDGVLGGDKLGTPGPVHEHGAPLLAVLHHARKQVAVALPGELPRSLRKPPSIMHLNAGSVFLARRGSATQGAQAVHHPSTVRCERCGLFLPVLATSGCLGHAPSRHCPMRTLRPVSAGVGNLRRLRPCRVQVFANVKGLPDSVRLSRCLVAVAASSLHRSSEGMCRGLQVASISA